MDRLKEHGNKALVPLILIIALFFLWALPNNLNDILIKHVKKTFTLSDFGSSLVQSAFYLGYFLVAMPAALFMRRFGYKAAVIVGLCLYGLGALLFYPAAELNAYIFFLGSLFIIACGAAFLETAANPLITVLGSPETAERRLNFAQSFNSVGSIIAILVGQNFILSGVEKTPEELAAMETSARSAYLASEAAMVQGPYLLIGALVLVWAVAILITKFPKVAVERAEGENLGQKGDFGRLLANRNYVTGVVAQFFYVGAQVGVWSFIIRYAQQAVPGMGEKTAASYLFWSIVGFAAGRFVGTALMGKIRADRLMTIYAVINIVLCLAAVVLGHGYLGLYALAATSFFMSIMFPTIFAVALRGLGPLAKLGSSFLIMSIIAGALMPMLMGLISDRTGNMAYAMVVPAICFGVIAMFAAKARNVPVAVTPVAP